MIRRFSFVLLAMTILQACSTTSAPEEASSTITEGTAECGSKTQNTPPEPIDCSVGDQSNPLVVYKWIDRDGNTYFGDMVPPEYSDTAEQVLITPRLPDGCPISVEPDSSGGSCTELHQAQARVTELYLRNLRIQLADLESRVTCCASDDTDLEVSAIEKSRCRKIRDMTRSIWRAEEQLARLKALCPLQLDPYSTVIAEFGD